MASSPPIPPGLTLEQLAFFNDYGYLAIPQYLSPTDITSLLNTTHHMLDTFSLSSHPLTRFTTGDDSADKPAKHVGDDYFLTSNDKIRFFFEPDAFSATESATLDRPKQLAVNKIGHALHDLSPPFAAVTHTGPIGARNAAIAASLGFRDPRVLQSMVICKQPGIGGAVPPHRDSEFLYTDPPSAVGWWFALQDAGAGNATLGMWAGSHRGSSGRIKRRFVRAPDGEGGTEFIDWSGTGHPQRMGPDDDGVESELQDERQPPLDAEAEVLELEAGTLVLIHGNVLHKSDKNLSERSRFAYTFHVIEGANGWLYDERNWLQPPEGGEGFTRLFA